MCIRQQRLQLWWESTALLVTFTTSLCSCACFAGCLQDNSLSLHVVHSLLAHKQIGAWNLSDIDRTSQIHFHLVEVLGELCQYGLREARWLSAACVTKTWHCEFVSHPKEEEEEDESECNSIDGFGKVHESLLEIFQVDPVFGNLWVEGKSTLCTRICPACCFSAYGYPLLDAHGQRAVLTSMPSYDSLSQQTQAIDLSAISCAEPRTME